MAQITVNLELGTKEAAHRWEFLCRIGASPKRCRQMGIKARLVSRPVTQFVERGSIKMRGTLEGFENRLHPTLP